MGSCDLLIFDPSAPSTVCDTSEVILSKIRDGMFESCKFEIKDWSENYHNGAINGKRKERQEKTQRRVKQITGLTTQGKGG